MPTPKTQITQLVKMRFPHISKTLSQQISQLIDHKHLYRIDSNNNVVLLINKIKQVVQDQTTPAHMRQFFFKEYFSRRQSLMPTGRPAQKKWSTYQEMAKQIYKHRNDLAYSVRQRQGLYNVSINRGGISITGPVLSQIGRHMLEIKLGGKILLDGIEPMTPRERNTAMDLLGELFHRLKPGTATARAKENIIKTFLMNKVYQEEQGRQKQKPFLTIPVQDVARLRMTLKSVKDVKYPHQEQNRVISILTKNYRNLSFFKQVSNLLLKVPSTPWTQFWQEKGKDIYGTKNNYINLHNPAVETLVPRRSPITGRYIDVPQYDIWWDDASSNLTDRREMLFPESDGRMLEWTVDVKNKAIIILIRGLGFLIEGEGPNDWILWRRSREMVIDISETGVIVLINDPEGSLTKLRYKVATFPAEINHNLNEIIAKAIRVYMGKSEQNTLNGDAYYRFRFSDSSVEFETFLPSQEYI